MEPELQSRKDQRAAKSRRKRGVAPLVAGIAVAALVPIIGSTYAANVTLNAGNDITFAQGEEITASCDTDIDITPASTYDEATGVFELDTVTLSQIDAGCLGKSIQLIVKLDGNENDIVNLPASTVVDTNSDNASDDIIVDLSASNTESALVTGFALEVRD